MYVWVGGGLFWVGCAPEYCVSVDQGCGCLVFINLTQLGLAGTPVQGMFSSDWPAGRSVYHFIF